MQSYKAGELIRIDAGTIHSMWNAGGNEAVVNWKVFPALGTEYLLETGMAWQRMKR